MIVAARRRVWIRFGGLGGVSRFGPGGTMSEKKRSRITVRCHDWEKRLLERAASEADTSVSELMRGGGRDRARRIIEESRHRDEERAEC